MDRSFFFALWLLINSAWFMRALTNDSAQGPCELLCTLARIYWQPLCQISSCVSNLKIGQAIQHSCRKRIEHSKYVYLKSARRYNEQHWTFASLEGDVTVISLTRSVLCTILYSYE